VLDDGHHYFRIGPNRTVMSGIYVVDIAEAQPCSGDCDGDHAVRVEELVTGVRVALGLEPLASCVVLDRDGDGAAGIDELLGAVRAALTTCAPPLLASPTPTPTNPPGMCCCGGYSFIECQALFAAGSCSGWGDPCPTPTASAAAPPPAPTGP
jgi:hypothetical protein